MSSRFAELLAGVALVMVAHAVPSSADWQWHRIAWEGIEVFSVTSPRDSAQVIYAAVSDWPDLPLEYHGVYKSVDGGLTWRFLEQSQNWECGRVTVDPRNSVAVYCGTITQVWNPDGWPWRSIDAGETWQRGQATSSRFVPSPWEDGVIVKVGSFGVMEYGVSITFDDGETWQGVCVSELNPNMDEKALFHATDSLVIFIGISGTQGTGLGRSTDGGHSWEIVLTGIEVPGFDQDPANGHHWIAITRESGSDTALVAESFDDGETWDTWPLETDDSEWPYEMDRGPVMFDLLNSSTLYMVARWGSHMIHRSDDGGHTWESMNDGFPANTSTYELFALPSAPGELLAARTDGLWLWTDRVLAEGPPLGGVHALRIEGVAPCPFRDAMTARFSSPSEGLVTAGIYSLEGRLVMTLMVGGVGAGRHELSWDGRASDGKLASPGAYVLRVETDKGRVAAMVVRAR